MRRKLLLALALFFITGGAHSWAQETPETGAGKPAWTLQIGGSSAPSYMVELSPEEVELIRQHRGGVPETPPAEAKSAEATEPAKVAEEAPGTPKPKGSRPETVGDFLNRAAASQGKPGAEKTPEAESREVPESGPYATVGPSQSTANSEARPWNPKEDGGRSTFFDKLLTVTWSLAFVALLVWVLAKIAEKLGVKQASVQADQKSAIEILEKKRLSPGRSVILMRVGPKVIAVAATEGGYETLTELSPEEYQSFRESHHPKTEGEGALPEQANLPEGAMTPSDVARHYMSIIPGLGAKK